MQALVLLPEWDCGSCTLKQQADRGCVEEAQRPVVLDGEKQLRCPRRPLLDHPAWYTELFWLYSNYSSGILPEGGGLDDQPHKLMASIRLLIQAREEAQAEKEAKDKRRKAFRDRAAQTFKPQQG